MKDISQCKHGLTQQWRHYFEIVLFSVRTLKTASRKQCYLCQKFLLPIPTHTWKISWIERLIFFGATRGKLAPFDSDVAKQCVSRNSVYHFFLLLSSSHSIPGVRKKAICSPVRHNRSKKKSIHSAIGLNRSKKITSVQPFNLTV